jgi:putative transcriptional regulator
MAIVVNLDLMLVKRMMQLTELSQRVGITLANLSILKTNKARAIRFSTLDALCRELQCQPADLLEYRPERPRTDDHRSALGPASRHAESQHDPQKGKASRSV